MPDGMKLPDFWYTPYFGKYASGQEIKLLRQEYTRLRDIAQKRITRLESAGLPIPDFRKGVPRLRDIRGNQSLFAHTLSDLYNFVKNPATLTEGAKETRSKMLERLSSSGFDVKAEQLPAFGAFMELLRLSGVEALPQFMYSEMGNVFARVSEGTEGLSKKRTIEKVEKAFRAYLKAEYDYTFVMKKGARPKWLKWR